MDGKGAWRDNVFVERLWRSVKYEEVYLHAYETVGDARAGLSRYFQFYNQRRPHTRFGGKNARRVLLRGAGGDPEGSLSDENGLPTASVVRSSQATPARRRGQPCRIASLTAENPLIQPPGAV